MIYNFTDFSEVRIFPLFLVMTSLWRHFSSHGFKFPSFLWKLPKAISLQSFSSVDCFSQFLKKDFKDTVWRHFIILGFEISIFCGTSYRLSSCQVSNPSVIWIKFYRGFHKTPPKTIMTSFWRYFTIFGFNIIYFVELNRRYQPAKFHWPRLSGSNFMRAGGTPPPPPRLTRSQKAQSL